MKKLVFLFLTTFIIGFIGSLFNGVVERNVDVLDDYAVFSFENDQFYDVLGFVDSYDGAVDVGFFVDGNDAYKFYVDEDYDLRKLMFVKPVILSSFDTYTISGSSSRTTELIVFGEREDLFLFFDMLDDAVTFNASNDVVANLLDLNVLFSEVMYHEVVSSVVFYVFIFLCLFICVYSFIFYNKMSKKIAINKLFNRWLYVAFDVFLVCLFLCSLVFLSMIYKVVFCCLIMFYFILKVYFYGVCDINASIKGMPIILNYDYMLFIYNIVLKTILGFVYFSFMMFVPTIIEYNQAYVLWDGVADYSMSDSAFVECCGNGVFADYNDLIWRNSYENYMLANYDGIIIPSAYNYNFVSSKLEDGVLSGVDSSKSNIIYRVSSGFFAIQGIDYDLDDVNGTLIVRESRVDDVALFVDGNYGVVTNDNTKVITIGDEPIYTFLPDVGFDTESSYFIEPGGAVDMNMINSDEIIYKNVLNDDSAVRSFYEFVNWDQKLLVVDGSFYEAGAKVVSNVKYLMMVLVFVFVVMIMIVVFISKNIIQLYHFKYCKKLCVKKIYGYSRWMIYRGYYIGYHFVDFVICLVIFIVSIYLDVVLYGLFLVVVHCFLSFFITYVMLFNKKSNKYLIRSLKGGI